MKRTILLGLMGLVVACGGGSSDPKTAADGTSSTVTSSASGKASVTSLAVASDSKKVDKVGGSDGALKPDGNQDLAFTTKVDGPITALFVVTVDDKGQPTTDYQADTLVGQGDMPKEFSGAVKAGHNTAGIGVFEGDKVLNQADGSVSVPAGSHTLTLYLADTGVLTPGTKVRVYAQGADKSLIQGPITSL